MPILKLKKGKRTYYKVANTTTKKKLTKKQALAQLRAIKINQRLRGKI